MNHLPHLDIIIPIFNHADYLNQCLSSVVEQTYAPKRVICVDDASSDPRIKQILQKFSSKHPHIQTIQLKTNTGICHAQNAAINQANSEYVAFLDCDDWLCPKALEIMAEALYKEPAGYAFSDRIDIHEDDKRQIIRSYGGQPQLQNIRNHKENLLDHMVASHLKVIRTSLIKELGGFIEGIDGVQDWDMALKISEKAHIIHVPEVVYFYRIHAGQNSSYDVVANSKKTNEVRRAAQNRRYPQRQRSVDLAQIPRLLQKISDSSPDFLDILTTSEVILAVDLESQFHFIPQSEICVKNLLKRTTLSEVLFLGKKEIYVDLLKYFWSGSPRPIIGYYLASFEGRIPAIVSCQRNNSYFDYIFCNPPEGPISLLNHTHGELKILTRKKEKTLAFKIKPQDLLISN